MTSPLIKPVGALCNMACRYCFYREKWRLYGGHARMTHAVLAEFLRQYLDSQPDGDVTFYWQGGEPLLAGLEFYANAVSLAEHYKRPGQRVRHNLQTNGTLLDDNWCRFFAGHVFLIGVSLDGPPELHDHYRKFRDGAPSARRVLAGIRNLQKHGVIWNAVCAVHARNAAHPLAVYRFLRERAGAQWVQFIPVVARQPTGSVYDYSVTPEQWGQFLTAIRTELNTHGGPPVALIEHARAVQTGECAQLCIFTATCGQAPVIEHNGDVYACDHFVDRVHLLGNLLDTPLSALLASTRQQSFGQAKADLPPACCDCPVLTYCYGECPKNRLPAPDGRSYLCAGYRRFFQEEAWTSMAF